MEKQNQIKICPKCGSENISFDSNYIEIWEICRECGLKMPKFPEIDPSQAESLRSELKRQGKKHL